MSTFQNKHQKINNIATTKTKNANIRNTISQKVTGINLI